MLDDDKEAVVALTLWSWQQMEESMVKRRLPSVAEAEVDEVDARVDLVDGSLDALAVGTAEVHVEGVDRLVPASGTLVVIDREQTPLPILVQSVRQVEQKDGSSSDVSSLDVASTTLRQCNTCAIADKCPGFRPDHGCAYSIPIEVRTKDQLTHLLSGMLEMQSQRVLFARMAEELEGGYPDPNLSNEMDRLFRLTEQFKDISDNRDFINIQVEAKGSAGVLSRLFGDHVGEQARALPSGGITPSETDHFIEQAFDIEEAEVVPD